MSEFMKKWAEELRTREKMLEDHSTRLVLEPGTSHRAELDELKGELDALARKLELMEQVADADWEASKQTLHADLEALDRDIHNWIRKTGEEAA